MSSFKNIHEWFRFVHRITLKFKYILSWCVSYIIHLLLERVYFSTIIYYRPSQKTEKGTMGVYLARWAATQAARFWFIHRRPLNASEFLFDVSYKIKGKHPIRFFSYIFKLEQNCMFRKLNKNDKNLTVFWMMSWK